MASWVYSWEQSIAILVLENWAGLTETVEVRQTLCCGFSAQVIRWLSELKYLLVMRWSKHTGDKLPEHFCKAWAFWHAKGVFRSWKICVSLHPNIQNTLLVWGSSWDTWSLLYTSHLGFLLYKADPQRLKCLSCPPLDSCRKGEPSQLLHFSLRTLLEQRWVFVSHPAWMIRCQQAGR